MSDTPRTDLAAIDAGDFYYKDKAVAVEVAKQLERELNAAIMFIKDLNATTAQPGRVYRARCGKFLRTALKPKTATSP